MDLEFFLNYTVLGKPVVPIVIAVSIVLLAFVLKNILAKIILKPLLSFGKRSHSDILVHVTEVIGPPLKLSIVFLGFYIASKWLDFPKLDPFINLFFKTFVTFIIFSILYRMVDKFSSLFSFFSSRMGTQINEDIQNFLTKSLRILVIVIAIMAILQEWGINVSAFVASLGLGGLAFALAAKDTVANLFGSLVIFSDRPFQIGDWVQTPDVEGNVEEIGIRSTKIRTFAQSLVNVPNATIANASITNWSRMGKRRVRTRLGLTYTTSIEQMKRIIEEITGMLENHPEVHKEVIVVNFDEFESSALSILVNFFTITISSKEHLNTRQDINFKIMDIVARHGASFAFPSQSLYVESLPK